MGNSSYAIRLLFSMRPTICLNMIVKDEEPVIRRCLDSVRPFIDHWVIVDTGSTDRTRELIGEFAREVAGSLHERPWRDFGHNRTEALELARGKADFILVMDADNIFCAPPGWHWPELPGESYDLLHRSDGVEYPQCILVSDRLTWRYVGVVHEFITSDMPHQTRLLEGPWIERRHQGARSRDPDTFRKDALALERALETDPSNTRNAFYLAQSWRDAGERQKALEAYRRRAGMGGWDEEVWYSLYKIAHLSELLERPAAEVVEAYLRAYQYRPRRAEPLVALAEWHRKRSEWALARLFARGAQAIPRPDDRLFVEEAAYAWRADDEAAVAASWLGNALESFALCCSLLDGDRLPDHERPRVESNRDFSADAVARMTERYPEEIVQRLASRPPAPAGTGLATLTVTTCKRLDLFEKTINSFLNCCRDIERIARFVCIDDNSSAGDRARMRSRYPFFRFILKEAHEKGHARSMNALADAVDTPYWLHLEDDWHFLVTTDYVTRAIAILQQEPHVGQVVFNRNYAETLANRTISGGDLRRHPSGFRYLLHQHFPEGPERDAHLASLPAGGLSNAWWPNFSLNPSLMRTASIRAVGRFDESVARFEQDFANRFTAAGLRTAFLDAVVCMHIGRLIGERGTGKPNAYDLNEVQQF